MFGLFGNTYQSKNSVPISAKASSRKKTKRKMKKDSRKNNRVK